MPTSERRLDKPYLPQFKTPRIGLQRSPYGIEFMRFEPDSPVPELINTVPHVAFEVDDIDAALAGKTVLSPPNAPTAGSRVAMIVHNGAPIELIQFARRLQGCPRESCVLAT